MKKHILALILTTTAMTGAFADPLEQVAFDKVNAQAKALPDAAKGVAFTIAILKGADFCKLPSGTTRALRESLGRLTQFASIVVPQDQLARANNAGGDAWMAMREDADFDCRTNTDIQEAVAKLPGLIAKELQRTSDPRKFNFKHIAPTSDN